MRRALRVVASVLLVCGTVLIGFGAPAGAAELADSGWWYVRPGLSGQPPNVPEGGLYLAGTPDGAISVAALRFTVGEDETEPELTLKASQAGAPEEGEEPPVPVPAGAAPAPPAESQPVILACQAGSGWTGEEAGSADAAPKVACGAGSVPGEAAADGTWTWDLSKLQVKTTVDIILVAGKVKDLPEGTNGSTFQLAFEKPSSASLATIEGAAPEPFTPPGGGELGGAPDLSSGAADGFSPDTGGGSVDSGTDVTFDAGDDTTSEGPALSEDQQGLTSTAPLAQAQQPAPAANASSTSEPRDTRWLGVVVVLLAGLVAVAANNQPVPPLQGLGPFRREAAGAGAGGAAAGTVAATSASGGLGRFSRSRSGPAPRL